jgi:hypothetical protein
MSLPQFGWMKRIHYTWRNIGSGILIYAAGDTIATFLTGDVSLVRLLGMAFLGATLYAIEVPNWFLLIDTWTSERKKDWKTGAMRMALALAYFNPLWIARHILFIHLFTGNFAAISWSIFPTAGMSFLTNIPLTLLGNYVIQNKVKFEWRYVGSSIFSSIMAISYAMGAVWFR